MRKTRAERARKDKPSFLPQRPAAAPAAPAPPPRRRLRWLGVACCFVLACGTAYVLAENFLVTRIPEALVGTWKVVGGEQDGVTLRFHRNGAFEAHVRRGDQEPVVRGHVEVEDKQVHIISQDSATGAKDKKTHIIRSISENEMVLEDPRGVASRLVRQH
jgi:uncharacterized protein (TIGR03066 family)